MTSAGTILRTTATLLNEAGLERDHLTNPNTGALSLPAAAFRAVTGKTSNAFTTDQTTGFLLIETNEHVMDALTWISTALPTEAPTDPDTGHDDPLEHIAIWVGQVDFFTDRKPTTADAIGVLQRAADLADRLHTLPAIRPAA